MPSPAVSSTDLKDLSSVRIVATIEARMTSSRLPGKVLADVGGMPMLEMMVRRLKRSQTLSGICLATTTSAEDDPLADLAGRLGVMHFRGSEDDVLARVVGAAQASEADVIVETTGDCPMIDPAILDGCVLSYFSSTCHYCSNALDGSFPRGLEVQVFSRDVLEEVEGTTQEPVDREHVSLFIYEHPECYVLRSVRAVGALRRPDWRWTVDTEHDLDFVRHVVANLGHDFSAAEAAAYLLESPDVVAINQHVEQKPVR